MRVGLKFGMLIVSAVVPFSTAWAQADEPLTLEALPVQGDDEAQLSHGWNPLLKIHANFSFGTSSDVIGQQNGDSITLGGKLEGGYSFKDEANEWRNTLNYAGSTSSTPTIPRYIKSLDLIEANTIYMRSLKSRPWLGPYAQVNLQAPVFKGEDVRSEPTDYVVDGAPVTTDVLRLTDSFRPLRTKESVGLFARIIEEEDLKITTRLGFGALQVTADGQYAIDDDPDTPEIEVRFLNSYAHVGAEAAIDLAGNIDEKTSYKLSAEILVPFNAEEPTEAERRNELELADVEIKAAIMTKMYEWMALNYEISFIKQPLLQERYQATSLLTVNFSHQLL